MSVTDQEIKAALRRHGGNKTAAAAELGMARSTFRGRLSKLSAPTEPERVVSKTSDRPPTLEEVLSESNVDTDEWEVERHVINRWQVGRKDKVESLTFNEGIIDGHIEDSGKFHKGWLYQVKVFLRRKPEAVRTVEQMLEDLAESRPAVKKVKRVKAKKASERNMLEVSITDLHLGMLCFGRESWSIEEASEAFMASIERLLSLAAPYNVERILFPIGNDYLHSEFTSATTKGTPQPEAMDTRWTFSKGKDLLIAAIDRLREVAPVHVISVPGNHANHAEFHMGHVIGAWYRNDPEVEVEFGPEPYRFVRFGANLIGFEHGNSIKPARLQAIMPAEVPDLWAATKFREWHLGDQHRKGSSSPVVFEELGVGVEYLPSLVPSNRWHQENGFSHQQRGSVAFLWNHELGPLARFHAPLGAL